MSEAEDSRIIFSAIILAAGLSRRMGAPKMVLPWGKTTVIGQVVDVMKNSGIQEIIAVTGGASEQVEGELSGMGVKIAYNKMHADGNMLTSLKCGLKALSIESEAAFIALGDQPFIEESIVRMMKREYQEQKAQIMTPSYQMHRGHPWLVRRELWNEILELPGIATMRDFLMNHARDIRYVVVDTPSVIADMDTPEDYARVKPDQN